MEQLMKKLKEDLEEIDLLTQEKDKLKDRYEDSKVYIGQLKEKIEHLKSKLENPSQSLLNLKLVMMIIQN